MESSKIEEEVRKIVEPILIDNNYILDEVLYVKEDGNYFLRIVIDKNGIIDIEDCVNVTHLVDPLLDDVEILTDSYILDICSKEKGCE